MNHDTINRNLKRDKIAIKILDCLKKSDIPLSTKEISDNLAISWHSVQTRCLKLQLTEKITGFRAGRINLWQLKN